MMMMILFSVLLTTIGVNVLLVEAGVDPYCDPDDYVLSESDPKLPRLPDQFYYSVEATIVEFDRTFFASEYLDEIGNRGRFDFTGRGEKMSAIADYNSGETFIFPNRRTGDSCTVSQLTTNRTAPPIARFLFGVVPGENNTVHIGAPSFAFYNFINTSVVRYIGINNTRGIPSYHWQACTVNENNSYTFDYYFTNGSLWSNSYDEEGYVPVAIELRGVRLNRTGMNVIQIEHYYSFVNYRSGPEAVPDQVFMVPTGLICLGRNPGKPLPPFPNFFSTGVEVVFNEQNSVLSLKEFYDLDHDLFRVDTSRNATGPFTFIQDFNTEATYYMQKNMVSCQVSQLTYDSASFDSTMGSDGHLHLRSVRSLLYADDSKNFVYEGVTNVRGNMVDVWIAQNWTELTIRNLTFTNITYQLYMTRPGQVISSEYGTSSDSVIWQITFAAVQTETNGTGFTKTSNVNATYSFFSFSPAEPPLDAYDILNCYSRDEFVNLNMKIPLDNRRFDQLNLKQSIRAGITDYAKRVGMPFLSPLQVVSVQIQRPDSDNDIHVQIHIANVSRNASAKWRYSAQALVDRMLQGVRIGQDLPFTITVGSSVVTPSYAEQEDIEVEESSEGLPTAAVAGVSIATFIVGVVVGGFVTLLIHLLFNHCRKKSSINLTSTTTTTTTTTRPEVAKYERHVDEEIPDVASDK